MQAIPFLSLAPQYDRIRGKLMESFKKVIDEGNFILGGEVDAFEKEYAAYTGVKHCVAVANGLDSLYISLKILGVGEGDEVIVPALTCAPTWMAVSRTGATVVPVDADAKTFNIDTHKIEQVVSLKTKVIMPVNLYGRPADLRAILTIANQKKCFVIEDNAQGHGASIHGQKTGSFGLINATSFYPTKNLGATGDGGAITTNDDDLDEKARCFRNYGSSHRFYHDVIGINSRLDELQAAFLRIKLKHLDDWNDERRELAAFYKRNLTGVGDMILPSDAESVYSAYHLFVVCTKRRDPLKKFLTQQGIETDIHYPVPPHLQKAYSQFGFSKGSFPVAEMICETILSLPLWPGMKMEQVDYVSQCVKKFFN